MPQKLSSKEHSAIPQAVQVLTASDKILRRAICPVHEKPTSFFQDAEDIDGKTMWRFRCRETGHAFFALPDRSAPKHIFEVKNWIAKQKQGRLQKMNSRGSA